MANKNNTVSTFVGVTKLKEVANSKVLTFTEEVAVEQTPKTPYNSSVKLQSLRDAFIRYDGQETGKHYEWNGAGSIQVVDALDAPYLLEKHIKTQSCCGENDTAIFRKVD